MNKLIKIEMERAFKNKMLIISVVIGLVIVGFNIWNEIIPARKTLDNCLRWENTAVYSFRDYI